MTAKDAEDPTFEQVGFMQQSLPHKLMEEPTLEGETSLKKLYEYNKLYHKQ